MEFDGFPRGLLDKKRPGAQVLELTDIVGLGVRRREQRIEAGDLFFFYMEHPAANTGGQPFMEAGSEIIGSETGDGILELCEAMSPVHHHFDAPAMCSIGDGTHRQDLTI